MFKQSICILTALLMSCSFVFGAAQQESFGPPPRADKLDDSTSFAQMKLQRAHAILAKLVPDPDSYHLMLSSYSSFGGEAVPPYVYSDKPTMIIYQGSLAPSRSNQEAAFLMAHEVSHLLLHHNENMNMAMEKIFTGSPIGISGTTFSIFYQKLQERQADLVGLKLYAKAGYDTHFFPYTLSLININPNIHFGSSKVFKKQLPSLSMKNSHFSIKERFELLTQEAASMQT